MVIDIRQERPGDIAAIRDVNAQAFSRDAEATIVEALRANGGALLSLVAEVDGQVVGHIMYSPLQVGDTQGAALGPMAVLPGYQGRGIGSRLVEEGNLRLDEAGLPFVVVLGHPAFYPRFGFEPASNHGISCEWDVPDEAFMVLVFDPARMQGVTGAARYRAEFSS